jgi:hypothetical protein
VLPLPADDLRKITAQLGPNVVGAAMPSDTIRDASFFFPLQQQSHIYQVTSGPKAGNLQTLGLATLDRPGRSAAWRFQMSPSLTGFIHQTLQGDLVIPTLSDLNQGVLLITTPANPFVPKGMQPGESRVFSQQVSVNYLDDPTDQRFSGSLNSIYTYVGTYQVTVPAGTFNALLLRGQCEGKVGPAHTRNTTYNFFAPGVGVIAMILQEDVSAFWIYNIDSTTGKVLMAR